MRGKLQRQFAFVDNAVTHQVGQRHFCGRDQRELLDLALFITLTGDRRMEQVVEELRRITENKPAK